MGRYILVLEVVVIVVVSVISVVIEMAMGMRYSGLMLLKLGISSYFTCL